MPFASNPLPLEFWLRMQARLDTEFSAQKSRLTEMLKPVPVTVDTGEHAIKQAVQTRQEVFANMQELENIQMLLMVLAGQVRLVSFRAELPDVEAHIKCLRSVAATYTDFLTGLPRRLITEQELNAAVAQYGSLRSAGSNEVAHAERQRLRAFTRDLPVVGIEDTAGYGRSVRSMYSNIDQLEANLQTLKATIQMQLTVPDNLVALVESFGVTMFAIEAPQLPTDQA